GHNWLAVIEDRDPRALGGLRRRFQPRAGVPFYYLVEGLKVGDVIRIRSRSRESQTEPPAPQAAENGLWRHSGNQRRVTQLHAAAERPYSACVFPISDV